MSSIDLFCYILKLIVDGSESYKINIGSTSPLHARENQKKLAVDKHSRKVIYKPETGEQYSLLVSDRAYQLLSVLRDGKWHCSESLKTTRNQTRKLISELRQFGLIIGTMRKPGQYKLFGEIELYPMGLGLGIKKVCETLPSLSQCKLIEDAKAKAAIAKRVVRIKTTVEFLEQGDA